MDRENTTLPYGHYGAIAAVACAVLLFEVLVTRILSVTLSYHFAFLTISLAMLGLAAPGVWFSLEPPRPYTLFVALYASAVALPGAVLAIVHLGAPRRGELPFWIAVILVPMLTPWHGDLRAPTAGARQADLSDVRRGSRGCRRRRTAGRSAAARSLDALRGRGAGRVADPGRNLRRLAPASDLARIRCRAGQHRRVGWTLSPSVCPFLYRGPPAAL
jgi:hypothetical protein